jgi:hypothetical protein
MPTILLQIDPDRISAKTHRDLKSAADGYTFGLAKTLQRKIPNAWPMWSLRLAGGFRRS